MRLLKNEDLASLDPGSWSQMAAEQMTAALGEKNSPFPCTFGIAGYATNQLRYCFIEGAADTDGATTQVAAALQSYLRIASSIGKNTSLVIFFNDAPNHTKQEYQEKFWRLLNRLHELDTSAWPASIPRDPDTDHWEFSFAGEPIFVVCNTPAHKNRKSRYSPYFTLTFQPRWVFADILTADELKTTKVTGAIRERIRLYDALPPSTHLSSFGSAKNREWKQYFLSDSGDETPQACPFHHAKTTEAPLVVTTTTLSVEDAIYSLLPPTGSVEVQFDTPWREHPEHAHSTDETLHIVDGEITFRLSGRAVKCGPGDRLLLPAHTRHAAVAGTQGCLYVIATRLVKPLSPSEEQS